jgi:hypothetical protein
VATKCLQVLLAYGWRNLIDIELAQQLLILLTLFAGGGPSSITISEELKREAFHTLALLYDDLRRTPKGSASLTEVSVMPALGQCLTTILDGITDGASSDIQIEALGASRSAWMCIKDQQALATFLPGTVSALTKCLMPSIKAPRSSKVLIRGLETLQTVLTTTIGDIKITNLKDNSTDDIIGPKATTTLTKSWLKVTSTQLKLALANIVKLRSHTNQDVRDELGRTCLILLDECHFSLEDSAALLVETSMIVATSPEENAELPRQTSLRDLAIIHPQINELIKTTVYNWATSLPRIMQSNDEMAKVSSLQHLSKAQTFMGDLSVGPGVLENALIECLRNSVVNVLEASSLKVVTHVSPIKDDIDSNLALTNQDDLLEDFRPVVMSHESQRNSRDQFNILIANTGSSESQLRMASGMLEQIYNSTGSGALSSFWLSFRLLQSAASKSKDLNDFFTTSITSSDEEDIVIEELYNYAVSILADLESGDKDWRLVAVCLEVIAYYSQRLEEAFRPNLVDTLYCVVELLGSSNSTLRQHAIATLNIISKSSGYENTSSLIVENVDYLVNAISLKLNTFNISPQTPRVLIMMVRLSGPSLLPYLDDVVGSIFAALDNFHGYPQLVDSLFSVLGEVVQESTKSGQLQLTFGTEISHKKQKSSPLRINDVVQLLGSMKDKSSARDDSKHEDFPREPWKSAKTLLDEAEVSKGEEEPEERLETNEIIKAPPTKVYTMVESIARLSQHYLTSPSPYLRLRLLNLLSTATSALRNNEDSFLPLVNDIWPVIIKRLYDSEPYVVIGAANTVAKTCEAAGDFMATRIQAEWQELMKLIRQWKSKAETERRGRHSRGVHSLNWQVWESMIGLMVAVLEYVRIDDSMFDDTCVILAGSLEREDVRRALEVVNADAVWLMDLAQGRVPARPTPVLEGYKFASIESL